MTRRYALLALVSLALGSSSCSLNSSKPDCASGSTMCGGTCANLLEDQLHCGACGNACGSGQVCSAGACALSCQAGLTACSGTCRDLQTDRAHCGACGIACAAGQVCSAGACGLSCQAGLANCGGTCRDLETDRNSCGACGNACLSGQVCSAGACGCGPGVSQCGLHALVYNDDPAASALAAPAMASLWGSTGLTTETTSGSEFASSYDAGGVDLVIVDAPDLALPDPVTSRLNDWVLCGGRTIFGWWNINASPGLQEVLGITAAYPYFTFRPVYEDPASPVNFWAGHATFPSPLAGHDVFAQNGVELTLPGAGFVAARLDSATGPGAIVVTQGNHVIVHGFLPGDAVATDANSNGVPDMQELYENEIVYLSDQSAGSTCLYVEGFERTAAWPWTPWALSSGSSYGSVSAACAHDGGQGFGDGGASGAFYYRNDVSAGNAGQRLSAWVNPGSSGSVAIGFGSHTAGGYSLVAAPGASRLVIQDNTHNWGAADVASVTQSFTASTWYRLEVDFAAGGTITGRLFGSDGVTQLNEVSATIPGLSAGAIYFRSAGTSCVDTIKVY